MQPTQPMTPSLYSQVKCHPGTRVAILDRLKRWAIRFDGSDEGGIMWLHGPAGTGKSAIQRTLAEILKELNLLLATFFFFRMDPERNSSYRFIETIAYQLATAIPSVRPRLEEAVRQDPRIFSKSLEVQAQSLIIGPVTSLGDDADFQATTCPRIIIVDGLDECVFNEQTMVIKVLHQIVQKAPFAIVIASRPEPQIQGIFNQEALQSACVPLTLDKSLNPDADIRHYLIDTFRFIRTTHPLRSTLPISDWPSVAIIDELVAKASGQFIYASTVDRFVSSPRHKPHERLDTILGVKIAGHQKPFEALDELYSAIFSSLEVGARRSALHVIGVLLVPYTNTFYDIRSERSIIQSRSPAFLDSLLRVKPGDVRSWLIDLHSLLLISRDHENIRFYHASLADYLHDRSRSGEHCVSPWYSYIKVLQYFVRYAFRKEEFEDPNLLPANDFLERFFRRCRHSYLTLVLFLVGSLFAVACRDTCSKLKKALRVAQPGPKAGRTWRVQGIVAHVARYPAHGIYHNRARQSALSALIGALSTLVPSVDVYA